MNATTEEVPAKPQKSAKSHKSEAAKAVVLARSAAGASNRQIAREMGIDRETVSRILSEPEIAAVIQQGKNDVVRMVPKALSVFNRALDKDHSRCSKRPDGGWGPEVRIEWRFGSSNAQHFDGPSFAPSGDINVPENRVTTPTRVAA